VFEMLTLPLNFPKMEFSALNFAFLDNNYFCIFWTAPLATGLLYDLLFNRLRYGLSTTFTACCIIKSVILLLIHKRLLVCYALLHMLLNLFEDFWIQYLIFCNAVATSVNMLSHFHVIP